MEVALQLVPFSFDGAAVRAFPLDGDPWFVGKDVAGALGYANPREAIRVHCKAARPVGGSVSLLPPLDPQTAIIPERDVYRLIMRSKLPSAERFEELVVGEILPSIRKTGTYGAPQIDLRDPEALLALLADHAKNELALKGQVSTLLPKAEALDRIADCDGTFAITEAAKTLQVRPKDLFDFLRQNRWIYRRPGSRHDLAYQSKIAQGLMKHRTSTAPQADGSERVFTQARITAKGLARLSEVLTETRTA